MSIASSILLTLPEVILSVSAIVLMLVAAYAGDKATRVVNGVAVAALFAAFLSLGQEGVAFDGLYSADAFANFAKPLIYLAAGVSILLSTRFFATEDRLLEGRDQLFQPRNALVLALVARICGDQQRLQRSNFFKQISGLRHGGGLAWRPFRCLPKAQTESSCRRAEPVIPRLPGPSPRWPEPAASRAPQTAPRTARGSSASAHPSRRAM